MEMSKSLLCETEDEMEELIQSLMDEGPNICLKCGHKMIQQFKTEWSELSTEVKMKCFHCGHTAHDDKKLLN